MKNFFRPCHCPRQYQRGFTLTELLVGTVVLGIGVALMPILLFGALDDRRGETEGKRAAIAAITERAAGGAATIGLSTQSLLAWSAAAANLGIEADDFGYAPFDQRGGLGRVHQLFGTELPKVIDELNRELVA